jgi:hypothetical protein
MTETAHGFISVAFDPERTFCPDRRGLSKLSNCGKFLGISFAKV